MAFPNGTLILESLYNVAMIVVKEKSYWIFFLPDFTYFISHGSTSITVKGRVAAPRFNIFHLCFYDYNMHVEGLLPANLCLYTVLRMQQFERFHPQHVQMVNKTSNFKTKLIGNNAEASRVIPVIPQYHFMFNFPTFYTYFFPLTNYCRANSGQKSWHPPFKQFPS